MATTTTTTTTNSIVNAAMASLAIAQAQVLVCSNPSLNPVQAAKAVHKAQCQLGTVLQQVYALQTCLRGQAKALQQLRT